MYHVSAQGVDERMINVHYYYYYYYTCRYVNSYATCSVVPRNCYASSSVVQRDLASHAFITLSCLCVLSQIISLFVAWFATSMGFFYADATTD